MTTAVVELTWSGSLYESNSGEQNGKEPDYINSKKNWAETRRHKKHGTFYFTEIATQMSDLCISKCAPQNERKS